MKARESSFSSFSPESTSSSPFYSPSHPLTPPFGPLQINRTNICNSIQTELFRAVSLWNNDVITGESSRKLLSKCPLFAYKYMDDKMYALLHPSTRRRATSTQHTHIHDTHKQTQNTRNNIIIFALLSIVSSNETFLFASLISENFRAGNFVCYSQLEIEQKVFTQSTHTHTLTPVTDSKLTMAWHRHNLIYIYPTILYRIYTIYYYYY